MRFLLVLVFFLLVGVVVSRTIDETAQELIHTLANSEFQDWSAAFLSSNSALRGPVLPSTLFVPVSTSGFDGKDDRRVAAYHIVPERLDFFTLCAKKNGTRLLTLLSGSLITISNISSGLALNGIQLTDADVYVDALVAIHRVASPLDVAMFAGDISASPGFNVWILVITVICVLSLMIIGKRSIQTCKSD